MTEKSSSAEVGHIQEIFRNNERRRVWVVRRSVCQRHERSVNCAVSGKTSRIGLKTSVIQASKVRIWRRVNIERKSLPQYLECSLVLSCFLGVRTLNTVKAFFSLCLLQYVSSKDPETLVWIYSETSVEHNTDDNSFVYWANVFINASNFVPVGWKKNHQRSSRV